jgi:hypothetical protein
MARQLRRAESARETLEATIDADEAKLQRPTDRGRR